jgi:UDP-N-acetylmuramoyl-L-alanyl-D-glutamate--2,6-diaminopimelate ligase
VPVSVGESKAKTSKSKGPLVSIPVSKLLKGFEATSISGDTDLAIRAIQYDSKLVQPGDLFVAIRGFQRDGHDFIPQALQSGASAIVAEKNGDYRPRLKILVEDSRLALAQLANNYHDCPSSKLSVVGVTGTNGKTTITYWLKSILEAAGQETGLIGTVRYYIGEREITSTRTTPESLDLQTLLAQMLQSDVKTAMMEVSSHALELKRVHGIDFKVAIFTNLTREHLDFHGTMENYRQAKGILFRGLSPGSVAVLNWDDSNSRHYANLTQAKRIFYSLKDNKAQFFAKSFKFSPKGTQALFVTPQGEERYHLELTGEFNLSNFAAVLATAQILGLDNQQIRKGAESFTGAPGRMEKIDWGQDFNIWIDYAHTPDGMERVLSTVKSFTSGRLIVLFGCGGDRDKGKRPEMGRVAEQYADLIILSSDNPRSEDPAKIAEEILSGIKDRNKVKVILDRKEALKLVVQSANSKDSVLVTGKGHENYQEIQGVKYPFSEREIIEEELKQLGYSEK